MHKKNKNCSIYNTSKKKYCFKKKIQKKEKKNKKKII